jgi:hypothetical protein
LLSASLGNNREIKGLQNITKKILEDQFQQVSSPKLEDAKSSIIKKRISEAVYRKLNKNTDVQLTLAQTKAQ